LLPIELTNEEIMNFNASKEFVAIATGAVPPNPKANGDDDDEDNDGKEEIRDEESFDPISRTLKNSDDEGNGDEDLGLNIYGEEGHVEEEEENELYKDVNINQGRGIQENLEVEDSHVILTLVNPDGQQQTSSVSSQFVTSMLKLTLDVGMESIFETTSQMNTQTPTSMTPLPMTAPTMTPSTIATITTTSQAPILPTTISKLAKRSDSRSSFNELMDTPLDFSNFLINRLKVDTLTPKLLAGPTYELIKGSCKSLVEPEYHLEEVFKATTYQLDWVNPKGQQYPHNLLKPLPLIPNNRGHRVIPFKHFINNDLEYLRGGASSRKYTTSIMKTNAVDYGHIKWIEDLQFYGFAVNWESTRDVYSKRRIIAVTELKIVEWHSYKHLDWITVRIDDDKLYKFKEGDFKRLRIQDIEDISIVIQRCMEDLQLGVESYQKKLNLMKPDSYRSDLKHKEAYTAYSNPRGFIYQNKDKKNRLMRIDELHKFSDGTLIDVRTALDDRLKGIRMQYLPQSIWRKSDKDRAAAMIQAIDKRLKTRRIMRSLERFVGGRLYERDFRMLQRTI
nr:hypothetical protein [Tanacetum cinerariifolium]